MSILSWCRSSTAWFWEHFVWPMDDHLAVARRLRAMDQEARRRTYGSVAERVHETPAALDTDKEVGDGRFIILPDYLPLMLQWRSEKPHLWRELCAVLEVQCNDQRELTRSAHAQGVALFSVFIAFGSLVVAVVAMTSSK